MSIKSIDKSSVHRITSGQVLVDLQTAVKELVENSFDAGATNIEVRFHDYGLKAFEVIDNGNGITSEDYEHVGLKHFTSKLSSFEDLTVVRTFGFRGEALSSLCALSEQVTITTATADDAPMGTVLELDRTGKLISRSKRTARQRGTSVLAEGLFKPLPVRRKEFERNSKREFGKALNLLTAYALVPCARENKGVRLSVLHQQGVRKSHQLRTDGQPSLKASVSSLWGPKQVEALVELHIDLEVAPEKTVIKRLGITGVVAPTKIQVRGLISKFAHGFGRSGSDRQYFFINGRPCNPSKIQKAFNEVYRTFNATQSPFIVADFIIPTNACDINVSPDKRTILIHSENALVAALKTALEEAYSPSRSTFAVQLTQNQTQKPSLPEFSDDPVTSDTQDMVDGDSEVAMNLDMQPIADEESSIRPPKLQQQDTTPLADLNIEMGESQSSSFNLHPPSQTESQTKANSDDKAISTQTLSPLLLTSATLSTSKELPVSKPLRRPIQMVLGTSNASWAMQPAGNEPPQKKIKTNNNSRSTFRSHLSSFAASGSQCETNLEYSEDGDDNVEANDVDEDEDEFASEELDEHAMDPEAADEDSSLEPILDINTSLSRDTCPRDNFEDNEQPLFLPENEPIHLASDTLMSPKESPSTILLNDKLTEDAGDVQDLTEEQRANLQALGNSSTTPIDIDSGSHSSGVEIRRTNSLGKDVSMTCDLPLICSSWDSIKVNRQSVLSTFSSANAQAKVGTSASISSEADEQDVERELSRIIDKSDFGQMDIVGQFNRGFIIARRQTLRAREGEAYSLRDDLDDLFIIDQHAADEKYNFETLQQSTKIDSQKLFKPQSLELTAGDELLAMDNIEVLRNNGFEIAFDADAKPSQGRLKLVSQPVSGNTTFDMKDLEELLHLMRDRPAGQKMVRCSKVRAMFAMRACRKSVMIGMSLTHPQMTNVVRHMGTMDQPWNCPHGRPTMRHLVDLRETSISAVGTSNQSDKNAREVDWVDL